MGLFGIFGGGGGGKGGGDKSESKPARKRAPQGSADPDDPYSWERTRGENSAYSLLEKEEKAGFPGIGDDANDPSTAAGMAAAAAGAKRKVKLTDKDRHVFQYARNMTARQAWYYRDRMNVPRGPCTLPILREAWIHGVVDEHTLVWGPGLMDWLPARNVRTLVPQIRTVEVQLATWVKRTFVLGPALRRVRRMRAEARPEVPTEQIVRG